MADVPGPRSAPKRLIHHMGQDKKAQGGALTFILARRIGDTFVGQGGDPHTLRDFLIEQGANRDRGPRSSPSPPLIILLGLGLISAAETSMTAASRGRMHQLEREGDRAARRQPDDGRSGEHDRRHPAVQQRGQYRRLGPDDQRVGGSLPGPLGVIASTVIMTVLVVVFGEILPKTLAITRPDDRRPRFLSMPTYWVVRIFGPLARGAQWIVRQTLRPFGINLSMETDVLAAHEEIRGAVEYHHSEGVVESRDRRMLGGVLDLSEMDVSEVMVHRKSVEMLDADLPPARTGPPGSTAPTAACRSGATTDNIVGVLHVRDLVKVMAQTDVKIDKWLDVMGLRASRGSPRDDQPEGPAQRLPQARNHFALVVDEYGGLQGVVTAGGHPRGDRRRDRRRARRHGRGCAQGPADGWVETAGTVTIRDLNRAMDWDLPDDQAVTIAGLLIQEAQTIPKIGQTFIFHRHRFQVVKRVRNQITTLRVSAPLDANTSASEA
jgi:Mg2+/Co2+ transporter CorB